MHTVVRRASWEEGDDFVPLFLLSASFFKSFLKDTGRLERALRLLFSRRNTLLSFEHTYFVLLGETKVGMALGYRSGIRRKESLRTGLLLGYSLGWQMMNTFSFWVSLGRATRVDHPATYYLSNLAVSPEYQRKGFGKTLLAFMESEARKEDCRWIALDVEKENVFAIRFYERLGYRITGEKTLLSRGRSTHLYRMVKDLLEGNVSPECSFDRKVRGI